MRVCVCVCGCGCVCVYVCVCVHVGVYACVCCALTCKCMHALCASTVTFDSRSVDDFFSKNPFVTDPYLTMQLESQRKQNETG